MPPPEDLTTVALTLYGLPPEEFVPARTAAERRARAAGDRALAGAVKALRRPPAAAWAVNLLVRERRPLVEQVVALGASLREAQAGLQGEALRELSRQRRQLVAAVGAQARELAAAAGHRLGDAAARQVEETLQAALADPAAAQAVLSGLLAEPLSSTGVESLTGALAVAAPAPSRPALSVVRDDGRARREAEERVAAAQKALRRAAKAVAAVGRKREKTRARVLQLEAELEELRRLLAEREAASEEAAERLEELEADAEEAEAELADAQAEAEAAAAALEAL